MEAANEAGQAMTLAIAGVAYIIGVFTGIVFWAVLTHLGEDDE